MSKTKKAANAFIDLVTPNKPKKSPLVAAKEAHTQQTRMGDVGFDPRYDERILEQQRLNDLTTTVNRQASQEIPSVYLPDYEGYGYVSSMADRSAGGGTLVDINGVPLNRPVDLQGGQSYMFENPSQVWASATAPVRAIMMQAAAARALTGKDPLYLPWRMAPTGSDFATMTGETMLSFANANMGGDAKKALNAKIKEFIPDWKGVDDPKSVDQFRSTPDAKRKAIHKMMDRDFRDEGGLSIGEARLSIADPQQLNAPEGYLMNVGRIFSDQPIIQQSGHPSYPKGVPGEGIGRLADDRSLFELNPKVFPRERNIRSLLVDPNTAQGAYENLPDVVTARGIADPRTPSFNDTRALQMKPYYGILTEEILRGMGYAEGGAVHKADGGMVDSVPEEAIKNTVKAPQAARLLDLDLAKYALMNQPQGMAGGGAVRMAQGGQVLAEAIGGQVQTPIQGDMGKMSFEDYRKSIGMHEGGRHMAQGGQVQQFKDGGKGEKTGFEEIFDLKPNQPSDVKSTSDKPQPKVPAFSVRDLVARIGSDRAKYEELAADPLTPFKNLLPIDAAAVRLLEAANKSGNPERYLETMSPYHDSQLRFNTYDSDSPYPEWGGWVDPDDPRVANVNMHPSGDIIVPHELAHTKQFLSGQVDQKPLLNNPVYDSAKDLPEDVRKNVLWGGNAGDNPMELWANIEAYAHKYNAAGGDFINSPEGRAMFPTPELQREYYTRTIPETSSATPSTGTFVANPPPPPAPVDRSNQSYAQQAMRALGFAEGGQVQRFEDGGEVSQDQMRYELDRANSPVMQAKPRGAVQDFIGTVGGYMDKAGKFVSEAIEPTAEKHPVKHFLANMLLADSLKSAGTLMQDLTGTAREEDEDNPVRGIIDKDWRKLSTSTAPLLDPRALDLAGFAAPIVKGATKLGQAGAKAITPFAKSTAEMAAELYGSGKMTGMVAPNAYMAEPSAPKPAKILAPANEQGFYSPTEAAALNVQRRSGSGQAFLNDIMKGENVKSDEINAMGLDTFLKDKKNVTAAEVQDYIAQNKLGLGESRYDDSITENPMGIPEHKETKFKQHSLPGGENYREVVITTPIENQDALNAAQTKAGDLRRQTGDLMEQWKNLSNVSKPGDPAVLEAYQKVADSRKLMNQAEAEADALRTTASNKTYRSSHWDEPNVLAHLRMSDRVTDGKKTLLVDEVQSDWHQAGREKGYKLPPEATAPMDSEYRALVHKNADAVAQGLTPDPKDVARAKMLEEQLMQSDSSKIPNAPYKEDWYQLALRRAVKEAIDGGYDRVALPTGDRVNERFSLTKYIDRIAHKKNADGTYSLAAVDKEGRTALNDKSVPQDKLAGIVGKEVAQKIIDAEGKGYPKGSVSEDMLILSGLDLKVGGEGNRKYYDEIYPNYLKKFGKKYGASVGTTYAKTDIQEWPFPIQIESDGKNFWLFGQDPRIDKKAKLSSNFSSYEDANKFRDSMYEGNTEPLHYIDITPAMRKEFSTGIHMAKGGKVSFAKSADEMRKELLRNKHG